MKQSYKVEKLEIECRDEHTGSWKFAGHTTKGTEFLYEVKDENFDRLNTWIIAVRVPKDAYGDIVVQPVQTPGKKVWAELARRSIVLARATKADFRSSVYCKVNLADPSGWQTKLGTRRGDRNALPKWFDPFLWRMRLKDTVTTTRGTDGKAQVVLMDHDDHATMIKFYFALKVWVLEEGFSL